MESFSHKILKILGLFSFYLFLFFSKNLHLSLIILPAIFIFFKLSFNLKLKLILLFSIFDFPLSLSFTSPYEVSFLYPIMQKRFSAISLMILIPILNSLVLISSIFLAKLLILMRKKIILPNVTFFCFIISLNIYLHHYFSHINKDSSLLLVVFFSILAKKLWLVFILTYPLQLKSITKEELAASFFINTSFFREHFKITQYAKESKAISYLLLYFSFIGVILLVISKLIIDLTSAQPECSLNLSNLQSFFCFLGNRLSKDFLKSVLAEPLIFYLIPLSLGFDMSRPWSDFWKFKNWNNLLSKLFYFYSLLISTIFIQDFYKLFQKSALINKKIKIFFSVLFGVFVGGVCFHLNKDFVFNEKITSNLILIQLTNIRFLSYFILLALSCALVEILKGKLKDLTNWAIAVTFFIFFIIVRSYFAGYFIKN